MMPAWLQSVAAVSLAAGVGSALFIAVDIARGRRQKMAIMNVVWPITGLWAGALGLAGYLRYGRAPRAGEQATKPTRAGHGTHGGDPPVPVAAARGTTHCGAGCTLGDVAAELWVLAFPLALFGHRLFGTWAYDYVFALTFGIAFQYLAIRPMNHDLSVGSTLKRAIAADFLSLTAWQVGMYAWMALATFGIFGHELSKGGPTFWFMMQIAMLLGFFTSYPVNVWLVRRGIKEAM